MIEGKRFVAEATVENRLACREAWMAAGFAVEFALKALIIKRERLNAWPSKDSRPEMYTHDLRSLFSLAQVDLADAPATLRGALRTVLDWNRGHEYTSGQMSRANARSMKKAVFDEEGVLAWLLKI
jgi:hypothetical protein